MNKNKISLVKLHGSINWFKYRKDKYGDDAIGIPLNGVFWRTKNPDGDYQHPVLGRPMFLVGTFNKIIDYTYDVYFKLHYHFYEKLESTHRIVITGYSFSDKGINTRLLEWLYNREENILVVIHPDPEKLKFSSRGEIASRWDDWLKEKKLSIIRKGIEQTNWNDIKVLFQR